MSREIFGLKDEPFSAYPDNKYFFSSIHHDKAITLLEYGLNSRKGFMLLTGLKGTGKTMTCNILKDSVRNCNVSFVEYADTTPDKLMKQICGGFGMDFKETGSQELFGRIMEFFVEQYKEGRNNLIIIDEAENISDACLSILNDFMEIEIEKCKLVQVVLAGCPELHDRLKHLDGDLGPKFTFTVELAPLTMKDTADYIEYRLKTAVGDEDYHLFKNNSYAEIYSYSKGIPSEVNRIAQKALAIAKEKKQGKVTPRHIKMAAARLYGVRGTRKGSKLPVIALVVILLLAGGAYLFRDRLVWPAKAVQVAEKPAPAEKPVTLSTEHPPPVMQDIAKTEPAEEPLKPAPAEAKAPEPAAKPAAVQKQPAAAPAEKAPVKTEPQVTKPKPVKAAPAAENPAPVIKKTEPAPAETIPAVKHGCITAQSGLKVRAGASVRSELIGTAPSMAYIELLSLSPDGKWWQTKYEGKVGYMYAKYIKVVESPEECGK